MKIKTLQQSTRIKDDLALLRQQMSRLLGVQLSTFARLKVNLSSEVSSNNDINYDIERILTEMFKEIEELFKNKIVEKQNEFRNL